MTLTPEQKQDIREVGNNIEYLEDRFIQQKKFIDTDGKPIFITDLDIERISSLDLNRIRDSLRLLSQEQYMVFDNIQQGYYFDDKGNDLPVEIIVRSRIFHTIWCITQTETVASPVNFQNVGDWKYVKHVKKIEERNIHLGTIYQDNNYPEVQKIITKIGGQFISELFDHISNNLEHFNGISNFQRRSVIITLDRLAKQTQSPTDGLTIVAGTGQGKSFAYQFPLLIWILLKKLSVYEQLLHGKIKQNQLNVNCSGLLLFPRIALADDQNKGLIKLINIINDYIENSNIAQTAKKTFLKIKPPVVDHSHGTGGPESYRGRPDIIITTPSSLENRLSDPRCSDLFREGIDVVLYDEVHLHKGIAGAEITAHNVRLQNLFSKPTLFMGMSATIDKPELHCQKLFALGTSPEIIQPDEIEIENGIDFTIEHHLMLKPAGGRSHAGVALETTSCLLHNRRIGGLRRWHEADGHNYDNQRITADIQNFLREKPKTITFINSLDGSGKYVEDINDYENYLSDTTKFGGNGGESIPHPPEKKPKKKYYFYNKPKQGQSFDSANNSYSESCENCINKISPDVLDCEFYRRGECWYFSQDDSNQFNQSRWRPVARPTNGEPPTWMPFDNIRSKRVSSKETSQTDIEKYFMENKQVWDRDAPPLGGRRQPHYGNNIQIDNVVSTPTLEVGVDFDHVEEIIQFGSVDSASSYKQKAGRGAREGNVNSGLFVMSVIDTTPTSYFHFKHFERLVKSSLDPIRLEPLNENVVNTHIFRSIFDYFSKEGIDLFQIRKGPNNRFTHDEVLDQYSNAIAILQTAKLKKYLKNFLDIIKFNDPNKVDEAIQYTTEFLQELGGEISLEVGGNQETHTLHEWLIKSMEEQRYLRTLGDRLESNNRIEEKNRDIIQQLDKFEQIFRQQYPNDNQFFDEIEKIRREILDG